MYFNSFVGEAWVKAYEIALFREFLFPDSKNRARHLCLSEYNQSTCNEWHKQMATNRTIAIGDAHGFSTALAALIKRIDPSPTDTIVTLGD